MFDFVPKHIVMTSEVIAWIKKAQLHHGIEGVTFLGGEPMLQARGLAEVAVSARLTGLSVMVFTGYRLEELMASAISGVKDLLAVTDVLVDGKYVANLPERKRNWAGSTNQRFHFLTNRYQRGIEYDPNYPHGCEIRIGDNNQIHLNGWPVSLPETPPQERK